ncbi:probable RNA-binding protein 46 isoform X2 [Pocillopora verrucosa]|uniref:APOBEC1 complementation factor-like isoform X2 n=1 Tax=Pocillopora damicornis TaxID=46731 RepID=UPI000F550726|nr:APOBEC1 complementation factor-like isoform X2 [Pocillopora damicornis]XP_058971573.1 APOBEC1 complementation factor-like isoform X2 [Pocillopora verrucosa]
MTINQVATRSSRQMGEEMASKIEEGSDRGTDGVAGTPKEAALRELMNRTKYPIRQFNGQRRYGPPPSWDAPPPPRGCEVFVGKVPRDLYEDELVPVFETFGKIYEVRLMMDFNGQNRGYAFVVYTNKEDAKKSVKALNNYEIRKGKCIGVCSSVDNCRLFVGGIPKKVKKDEIMNEMMKVTESVVDVIVYPSAQDKTKNRGFAFVEYSSHRDAAMARRKLMTGKIQLWGHQIAVDWAEPEQEVDEEIMDQVKVLYARNLLLSTTEDTIEQVFSKFGDVERVKKIKDYSFIHFRTKEQARAALEAMNGEELDGNEIEVTLAKPVDKDHRQAKAAAKAIMTATTYPSLAPYEYSASTVPGYGFPAYGSQYFMYGAPMTTGVGGVRPPFGMVRARGRGRSAAGSRAAGNKGVYLPSPGGYSFNGFRSYYPAVRGGWYGDGYNKRGGRQEVLEDVCQKNQWGSPVYTLHSTVGPQDIQLFLHKVSIPGLATQYQPPKLCRTVEEAKSYAAEYTLQQLGVPIEVVTTTAATDIPPTTGTPVPSTAAYAARPLPPGAYSLPNSGRPISSVDGGSYPSGYVPISNAPTSVAPPAVVAKMQGSWPGGVPPTQDGGMYGGYDGYPTSEQGGYPQNIYPQY